MNNKPYKILIAHYRTDIVSGAENSITDLVSKVDSRFQITMLVSNEGKLSAFFKRNGINVWERAVSTPRRIMPGLHTIQSISFARDLRKEKFDAVICNTMAAASRVASAAKYAKLPLGIYMRDYIKNTAANRQILNRANAIFAISNDVKNLTSSMAPREKIHLTYNYINPDPVLERQKSHLASKHRLLPFPNCEVIGWVGRLTPYKQPEVFIHAIPIILSVYPQARFVIIGSAQEKEKAYETYLKSLVASLGIENSIAFLGQRSDVIELSSELSISCLTSQREPLGRVILEANILRIPTVVPDIGGPAEIIDNEKTGLQFSPQAHDAHNQLADKIIRLLLNPDLRSNLVENGYRKVFSSFANRDHVSIQERLYEQLCSYQL
jgi:glycosyltransferase involved in cell wall biosynthesis